MFGKLETLIAEFATSTQLPLLPSASPRGITTVFSRWSRVSLTFDLPISTTTSCEQCSAPQTERFERRRHPAAADPRWQSGSLADPNDRGIGGNSGHLRSAISRSFLEFTFKAEYAYDYGMPQWLARVDRTFSRLRLERLFLGRHKTITFSDVVSRFAL